MSWFHPNHAFASRLRPQLAAAQRRFESWEVHPSWLHTLARWLEDSRRGIGLAFGRWSKVVAANSECASVAFFVILIALTFLI